MSEEESVNRKPWENLQDILKAGSSHVLSSYIQSLSAMELALAISRLSQDEQTLLLGLLSPQDAADLIDHIEDIQAVDMIEDLPPEEAAAIVDALDSDAQADLLGNMEEDEAEAILEAMSDESAKDVRQLLQYGDDTAGGTMITEFVTYMADQCIQDVIDDLRRHHETFVDYDIQYLYVSDPYRLVGVLRIRDVMLASPDQPLTAIMIKDPVHVDVATPIRDLHDLFDTHTYLGLPVTDENGKLVGIVRRADVQEELAKQRENEFREASGIVGGEELRSMPMFKRAYRRLSWLSVNVVLNILAASVIAFYQDTLEKAITLAVFLPIISDMSGCSGNQAVAVSIRELTLGLVRPREILRVLAKESGVGVLNGIVLGGLLAGAAMLWKGNPYLGLVVGVALAVNTVVAVCLGGMIPLILKGFKSDPALASGPMLTTVTDMCGFFLVLSLAQMMLSKLI